MARTTPTKIETKLRNHPDIVELWEEDDGYNEHGTAWWAVLRPGLCRDDGAHSLHECTLTEIARELRRAEPCVCDTCREDIANKEAKQKKETEMKGINPTLKAVATVCFNREKKMGTKGKRRDANALEFMCGASQALVTVDHPDAQCVLAVTAMLITTRGFSEIERLVEQPATSDKE